MTVRKLASLAVLSLALVLANSSTALAGKKGDRGKFPVAGADFKQHVQARIEKKRAKLEAKIAEKKLPEEKAKEMRERFASGAAKVNAQVEKAVADGTVTKEEAAEVRAVAKEMRGHGRGKGKRKAA